MRFHRFFIQGLDVSRNTISLSDSNVIHQIKDVFRLGKGDTILLLSGDGIEHTCAITLASKDAVECSVVSSERITFEPKVKLHLFISLIKKDHFEWVLEKATELGVTEFTPVISERTEKKDFNNERGLKIIREAAEQSGKGVLATLNDVVTLEEALKNNEEKAAALHLEGSQFKKELEKNAERLSLFIGPEGGWSPNDLALFQKYNVPLVCLGKQILRAETASIAAATLLLLS